MEEGIRSRLLLFNHHLSLLEAMVMDGITGFL